MMTAIASASAIALEEMTNESFLNGNTGFVKIAARRGRGSEIRAESADNRVAMKGKKKS